MSKRLSWVHETVGSITRLSKRLSLGAGLQRLLDTGSDIGCRVLRPRLWSVTRFAPYAADVLRTFSTNVPAMTHALQQQIESETRRSVSGELLDELKLLKRKLNRTVSTPASVYWYHCLESFEIILFICIVYSIFGCSIHIQHVHRGLKACSVTANVPYSTPGENLCCLR